MAARKEIFAIIGSASTNSSNQRLVEYLARNAGNEFNFTIFNRLKELPHFDPEQSIYNPPQIIVEFREAIEKANSIIICTPEYVFSIPSGLKNAIEWCVSTTVFSDKVTGLITASAQGKYGHAELKLLMKTLMASFTDDISLLIEGVKGKFDETGDLNDRKTIEDLARFLEAFKALL